MQGVELQGPEDPEELTLPDACWSSLQHLTHLQVTCKQQLISEQVLHDFSVLSNLQHLHLGCEGCPRQLPSCLCWLLPLTSLTALGLESALELRIPAPGFAALPHLQCLTLISCSAKPEVLVGITGLQRLSLVRYSVRIEFHIFEDCEWDPNTMTVMTYIVGA